MTFPHPSPPSPGAVQGRTRSGLSRRAFNQHLLALTLASVAPRPALALADLQSDLWLNRLTFGATPALRAEGAAIGVTPGWRRSWRCRSATPHWISGWPMPVF